MKKTLLALTLLHVSVSFAQITVIDTDFPVGDDTVRVSISLDTGLDLFTTGTNATWDFSTLNIETQRIDTFHAISGAPALYQLVFNNGFTNPDYQSDYFLPWQNLDFSQASQLGLSIESPVFFTKVENDKVEITGFGLVANGISIPAQSDTIDVQYDLPMNYGDSWVSNSYTNLDLNPTFNGIYRRHQQRNVIVDGWGQITTPFQTYDAIRVKSLISSQDSLYIDLGFGGTWLELPVPDQIQYDWFANGQKIPVLKVITQDMAGTETVTSVEFKDKKRDFASITGAEFSGSSYPNPATDQFNLTFNSQPESINVFDLSGKLVYSKTASIGTSLQIDVSQWISGTYLVQIVEKQSVSSVKLEVR